MARGFNAAQEQYLVDILSGVSIYPISCSFLFRVVDLEESGQMIYIGNEWRSNYFLIRYSEPSFQRFLTMMAYDGAASSINTGPGSLEDTDWHQAGAVIVGDTDRTYYFDGQSYHDDASVELANPNTLSLAVEGRAALVNYGTIELAELGVWTTALSDEDMQVLAAMASPLMSRPDSLLYYTPLVDDLDNDLVGDLDLFPVNSPTVEPHPRIYRSNTALWVPPSTVTEPELGPELSAWQENDFIGLSWTDVADNGEDSYYEIQRRTSP